MGEFEKIYLQIETHPEHYHFDPSGWRRANLENPAITCCFTRISMACKSRPYVMTAGILASVYGGNKISVQNGTSPPAL